MVRVKGLEPPRLTAPEPKSGASTNFATPALNTPIKVLPNLNGGYDGIRTCDPIIMSDVL